MIDLVGAGLWAVRMFTFTFDRTFSKSFDNQHGIMMNNPKGGIKRQQIVYRKRIGSVLFSIGRFSKIEFREEKEKLGASREYMSKSKLSTMYSKQVQFIHVRTVAHPSVDKVKYSH